MLQSSESFRRVALHLSGLVYELIALKGQFGSNGYHEKWIRWSREVQYLLWSWWMCRNLRRFRRIVIDAIFLAVWVAPKCVSFGNHIYFTVILGWCAIVDWAREVLLSMDCMCYLSSHSRQCSEFGSTRVVEPLWSYLITQGADRNTSVRDEQVLICYWIALGLKRTTCFQNLRYSFMMSSGHETLSGNVVQCGQSHGWWGGFTATPPRASHDIPKFRIFCFRARRHGCITDRLEQTRSR